MAGPDPAILFFGAPMRSDSILRARLSAVWRFRGGLSAVLGREVLGRLLAMVDRLPLPVAKLTLPFGNASAR
jgi:hypothetical protein